MTTHHSEHTTPTQLTCAAPSAKEWDMRHKVTRFLLIALYAVSISSLLVLLLPAFGLVSPPHASGMFLSGLLFAASAIGGWALRSNPSNQGSTLRGAWPMCVACIAFAAMYNEPSHAGTRQLMPQFTAKVIHVDDGDTLVVLVPGAGKLPVRLANIDAPETQKNRCKPGQPFGREAQILLAQTIKGQTAEFRCSALDRYDRHICDVFTPTGVSVSRVLVQQGLAWANRQNPAYLRDKEVGRLEEQAREQKSGLWSQSAVAPWVWRQTAWVDTCN